MRESNISPDKKIEFFWQRTFKNATESKLNLKDIILPLARIKRLMKVEEGVRMVASEVPIIFSLVAEKFVEELTLRAWINTEENKRRILQLNDISVAVKTSEMYDFLVYVVPRCEMNNVFDRMLGSSDKLYQHIPVVLGKSPMSLKNNMCSSFKNNDQCNLSIEYIMNKKKDEEDTKDM
ncbi:hypothetical protein NCER_101385 [Vairimorpha ceranae BRL01]|uniref:Transcription factor CBF/NF-Y/archaeal histone domain-containing protein n=2 Tax=Vairimorpha ceranae TaxID=40302 RepID=C4V9W7_VAIC1|nr:hypothetical protein NCER_101385 [Vairimorpha ceranae BRL01]